MRCPLPQSAQLQNAVTTSPIWRDLPAMKNGKVVEVPDETWMSGIGVQAANRMLGDVAKATGVEQPEVTRAQ